MKKVYKSTVSIVCLLCWCFLSCIGTVTAESCSDSPKNTVNAEERIAGIKQDVTESNDETLEHAKTVSSQVLSNGVYYLNNK